MSAQRPRIVCQFSCSATSAVATKLAQLLEARADGAKVNIEGWGK